MSKFVELKQAPDDSWTLEIPQDNGLVAVETIGKLSKEQAQRETIRRGYTHVRCWDKHVLQALAEGQVDLTRSKIE